MQLWRAAWLVQIKLVYRKQRKFAVHRKQRKFSKVSNHFLHFKLALIAIWNSFAIQNSPTISVSLYLARCHCTHRQCRLNHLELFSSQFTISETCSTTFDDDTFQSSRLFKYRKATARTRKEAVSRRRPVKNDAIFRISCRVVRRCRHRVPVACFLSYWPWLSVLQPDLTLDCSNRG